MLEEEDNGVETIIRSLKYHWGRARGRRRELIEEQLTYFRNQRHRMQYAQYVREGLPIGSGVVEAACKTLATQRMKQSGMSWGQDGGQAVLTLRSLIQSNRWDQGWQLLRTDFCKQVDVLKSKHDSSSTQHQKAPISLWTNNNITDYYRSLPLVA